MSIQIHPHLHIRHDIQPHGVDLRPVGYGEPRHGGRRNCHKRYECQHERYIHPLSDILFILILFILIPLIPDLCHHLLPS